MVRLNSLVCKKGFLKIFGNLKINHLTEYIKLKLPQAFGSINTKSVDGHSSILLELNGRELVENSLFTIPDLPMKRVESPCRRVKVSNQNSSNSNNHSL